MNFQQEVQISLTVLITGLVVVFLMLIFLTLVIKGYGNAVQSLLAKYHKSNSQDTVPIPKVEPTANPVQAPASKLAKTEPLSESLPAHEEGIPEEVLAVIAAAAYSVMPGGKITSVRRAGGTTRAMSSWKMAGLLKNTCPF